MPSTYSPSLRIELPGSGEQSGVWGTTTNNNLGTLLEQSIAGVQAITMTDANYTLSNYNGVSDEARKAVLVVSGTNAAVRDIIAPLTPKVYTIKNNTTGGYAINIRAPSGSSVSIPNGVTSSVYCDGTNFNLALTQTLVAAGTGISVGVVGATNTISFGPITSAQLAAAVSDETGSGAAVFATSPTLVTPNLGTPTTLVGTNITGTAASLTAGNATTATTATTATILNGTWNQMPAGTRVPFAQAAAPTGWTQDTSDNANNRMLRVVSGAGNGVGGSSSPILNNVVSSHTHTFTGNAMGAHSHSDAGHQHTQLWKASTGGTTAGGDPNSVGNTSVATGVGYANIQGASAGTPSGSISANGSASDWTPRYIDMIICSKN
jgi:hypothetical protein